MSSVSEECVKEIENERHDAQLEGGDKEREIANANK